MSFDLRLGSKTRVRRIVTDGHFGRLANARDGDASSRAAKMGRGAVCGSSADG